MIQFKVDLDYKGTRVGIPVDFTLDVYERLEDPILEAMLEAQSILAESLSDGSIYKYNDIMLSSQVVKVNLVNGGFTNVQ